MKAAGTAVTAVPAKRKFPKNRLLPPRSGFGSGCPDQPHRPVRSSAPSSAITPWVGYRDPGECWLATTSVVARNAAAR
jgi:hypothetical protein